MSRTARITDAVLPLLDAIPGAVAMATTADGTVYEAAFGHRDAGRELPMTTDTVFSLASMTKAVVSVAALLLVDQSRLSLDAPIGDTIPELAAPQVLDGFAADGTPRLRPPSGPVTLRHLLSHSSGYSHESLSADLGRYLDYLHRTEGLYRERGLPRMPENSADLARWPLLFDPGTRWNYGISTDIVGRAIEAASNQRLDHQMGSGILAELGMRDSGFVLTDALRARLTVTHMRQPDGRLDPIGFPMDRPARFCMGGGGMYGTGADYLRFIRLFLNHGCHAGTRLLSESALRAATTNQLAPGVAVERMATVVPGVANDDEFFPGMEKHWSAAFMINPEPASTGRRAGGLAWAGVVNTYFWIDPAAGIGGVFLAQLLPFYDRPVLDAFAAFERAVYDTFA